MKAKLLIAVISLIGLLLTTAVVIQFIRARSGPASNACANNLRQIDGAKAEWSLENKKTNGDLVTWSDIQPYMGRGPSGSLPVCPQGGTYIIGRIGETPRCSLDVKMPWHTLN